MVCDGADADFCDEGNYSCVGGAQSCDDPNSVNPEICDNVDNNCNGSTDEGVTSTFYRDADCDGYGNSGVTQQACSPSVGWCAWALG